MPGFLDDFDAAGLDASVWIPHYLPMWSSRAQTAATYAVHGSELRLTIPPDQGLWCPDLHEEPLRVSGVQSGVWSGPVGSARGQHAFRDGLVVREEQPAQWGWTPHFGLVELRARMELSPRSMAAAWMIGLEDEPGNSAEICIFEIFGDALSSDGDGPTAAVGMGTRAFGDRAIQGDFAAPRIAIDPAETHDYAVDWRPGRIEILIDGVPVRTVQEAPDYPMQLMIAVFDFPAKAASALAGHVPELAVDHVRGGRVV